MLGEIPDGGAHAADRAMVAESMTIHTIGHSRHTIERFVALLHAHRIERLVDVRSHPVSRHAPHFGKTALARALADAAIEYAFLGAALGGRPTGAAYYRRDGTLDHARRRRAPDFAAGIDELVALASTHRTAIMCAEEDPVHCHRRLLVAPSLVERGAAIVHIRKDGRAEAEAQLALL